MQIAFPIYDGLTVLDAVGPYEVLQQVPGYEPVFVGAKRGPVRSDGRRLTVVADATFDEVTEPAVIVVPGAPRPFVEKQLDGPLVEWIRRVHPGTRITASVCSGAILLAKAGLLDGLTATTHWMARTWLGELGAVPVTDRVVPHFEQRLITAAGVSSGIDMALTLLAENLVDPVGAQAAQLIVEYYPHPPFNAGGADQAGADVHARAADYMKGIGP